MIVGRNSSQLHYHCSDIGFDIFFIVGMSHSCLLECLKLNFYPIWPRATPNYSSRPFSALWNAINTRTIYKLSAHCYIVMLFITIFNYYCINSWFLLVFSSTYNKHILFGTHAGRCANFVCVCLCEFAWAIHTHSV